MAESVTSKVETITPTWAKSVLEAQQRAGYINRQLFGTVVENYADQMRSGQWMVNGQPLIFNGSRLLDGQHRLAAVTRAEVPVRMLVVRGVDADAFTTLDTGRKRRACDVLTIDGHIHTAALAAAVNLILQYRQHGVMGMNGQRSTPEIAAFAAQHRQELAEAYTLAAPAAVFARSPSVITALSFLVRGHLSRVPFFTALADGLNLTAGNPVYVLRQRILSEQAGVKATRVKVVAKAAYAVKAWSAYATGRSISRLQWKHDEDFPAIIGAS